ncbi:MAG: hypothetical protein K6E93_02825 [Bacteroidales bacterium]|nr:hypothetical protein [Bacteroidales bacterium]
MKIRIILFATLCIALTACNLDSINNNTEESSDTVEIIDAAASNHLTFKGVPIDGTLKQYVVQMTRAGFALVETQDGNALLRGDFAGYKGCQVYVSTIEGNDVVSYITVQFPVQNTWEHLYGNYKNLKDLLTEKYGRPSSVKEVFLRSSYSNTDAGKLGRVKDGDCKYETRFTTDKGEIVLWIDHERLFSTFVCLQYKDRVNSDIVKQHAINDL